MQRDPEIERRLQNWARWRIGSSAGVLGYAAVDLENAGMPRDPYAQAPIPTNDIEASETDEAVQGLPSELRETVTLFYVGAGSQAKKAATLGITERGMRARIEQVFRLLGSYYTDRSERSRAERERVEGLQRASSSRGFTEFR